MIRALIYLRLQHTENKLLDISFKISALINDGNTFGGPVLCSIQRKIQAFRLGKRILRVSIIIMMMWHVKIIVRRSCTMHQIPDYDFHIWLFWKHSTCICALFLDFSNFIIVFSSYDSPYSPISYSKYFRFWPYMILRHILQIWIKDINIWDIFYSLSLYFS